MLIPMETRRLDCAPAKRGEPMELHFGDGQVARARTLVIATGARYRRPAECSNLMALEGRGVWYWASPIEAKMCAGQEVVLVGGGNSAGQAAVYLSGHASKVWMLVRGPGLAASMSKYLIDRIAGTPNLELLTRTEITLPQRLAPVRRRNGDLDESQLGRAPEPPDPRPASLRSATCAPDRSSAWAAPSARARRWSRRSTPSSAPGERPRNPRPSIQIRRASAPFGSSGALPLGVWRVRAGLSRDRGR